MSQRLLLFMVLFVPSLALRAQNTISTQTLGVTSICPGSTVNVPFTRTGTYNANNAFTVQLSDGGDYKNIETEAPSFNSGTGVYTVAATIPQNQAAGTTYTLRVTATSPAVIGTPSATRLVIKTKPAPPVAPAEVTRCQRADGSNRYDVGWTVRVTSTDAIVKIYNSIGESINLLSNNGLGLEKFPVIPIADLLPSTITYYVSQVIDGCESDKTPVKLITLPKPLSGIVVDNIVGTGDGAVFGRVDYCQGDKALPLNEKGHKPVANGITVRYVKESGDLEFDGNPPTPKTDKVGTSQFSLLPSLNGCPASLRPTAYITVRVNPLPTKPTVSTNAISLCQFQQAGSLTASATSGASLVWYGTNATGGTGSPAASPPSTANAGTFKYYVAQKINDCESERAEITVEVKAASPAPTVSVVSYCQGAQANQLSAVAASGGSLTWYTAPSGGTGSPGGPTPLTNNVGVQTYYVAQTVGTNCESQRIPLNVTTNGLPTAPTVPKTTYTFCQNARGEALSASGQNLKWYETATGGTGAGSITPGTGTAGTKLYYVSQTVNNCEGPRTTVAVDILPVPAAPTVTQSTYEFCQGANAVISGTIAPGVGTNWYIYDNAPGLTNIYTSGNTAYATVSTAQARTMTYSVFQIATNGCSGPASQLINVTVKPTPSAPGVQAMAVCQNAAAPALQPTGQNLLWYATSTGGTGSATTPVVSTSQASQATYYVSQSLNGCESPRSALSVVVNAIPGVPTVEATGPAYCQNATAASLTATGSDLKWYRESAGGTSLGDKPVPDTKQAGSFTYYVSQTVNGCEGSRSSQTIKINAAPVTPSVTGAYSYCQKAPASVLTATGTGKLKWYGTDGKSSDAAPTPSTDAPGTVSYFVTQSADNCESARAEIKVTTKPTPGAPTTSAIVLCQNEPARTLSASGQNLVWYTAETGGNGSATTPTINTGQSGSTNYYVSQSLDGCEGPRAALSVTVKPLPVAPGVAQKDICQFAKAEPLTAQGNDLRWYYPDGKLVGATPTPPTDRGATYAYQVSQVANDCEGPRATLTVNILTTPTPTVGKSTVEVCVGSTPQPLQATGTNLRWTDPAGNVTTTTPTPPTLNATVKPEGDIFYVTQTGANGCESPRVAISVFVQTPPTLSIIGTTTTNLGLEVPLKLTFTGVGPYRYKLSDGTAGTSIKDTTILVVPTRTTTYQVVEVANKCGVGLPGSGATAVVTVNIPSIQTLAFTTTTLCAGSSLSTNFTTSGVFNTGSVFKLQYAKVETDSTKINFVDVPGSQAANGNITGLLPATVPAGTYWVRVMATNPKIPILGNISPTLLTVRSRATATLTGAQTIFEGQPAKLSVAFTGDGPWSFSYQDSTASGAGAVQTISTNANPHILEIRPAKTTAYFLTSVSNGCGNNTPAKALVVVNVAPLLGIEDQALADAVDIFPVPTTTTLTVRIKGLAAKEPALLELIDLTGHTTLRHETRRETSVLSLDHQPAGTYVLRIRVGDRTASKRILKL